MNKKHYRLVLDYNRRLVVATLQLKKIILRSLFIDYRLSFQERQILYTKYINPNSNFTLSRLRIIVFQRANQEEYIGVFY